MALDLVEQGEDYMVVRSTSTGGLYAVVLDATKGVEDLRAAPLAAWLSSGKVLGPGDVPAGRKPAATRSGERQRGRPGQTRDIVVGLLREHGELTVKQMQELGAPGGAHSAVVRLEEKGVATHRAEQVPGSPVATHIYRLVEEGETPPPPPRRVAAPSGSRSEQVLNIVREHGPITAADINPHLGLDRSSTNVFGVLRRLGENGQVSYREERVEDPDNPTGVRVVRMFYANEPSGPTESQRDSSESTQPV